jgi:hypothetical protein
MKNLNMILTIAAPAWALTKVQLKVQLQSNLHSNLRLNLSLEPIMATDLATWAFEVKEQDDRMWAEDTCTPKLIDSCLATCMVHCSKKKDHLSQSIDPPLASSSSSTEKLKRDTRACLCPLTKAERTLIKDHVGCTWCRCLNVRHSFNECPIKDTNTWPDPATYTKRGR